MSDGPFEGGIFGFPFGPPSEEQMQKMREAHEQRHMHIQDNSHALKQLLDDLDVDQLHALDIMLANCGNPASVAYFRGRVEMVLQYAHGVCPCGEEHDPSKMFDTEPLPQQKAPVVPNTATSHGGKPIEDVELPGPNESELMAEYGIERDPNYGKPMTPDMELPPQPFRCIGCGIGVASLEDRMRRKPGIDGCSGCQQKSAFG